MATQPATQPETIPASVELGGLHLAEELLELAERAQAYTNAVGAAIAVVRGNELVVRTASGNAPEVGANIKLEGTLTGAALRTGRPEVWRERDGEAKLDTAFRNLRARSVTIVPVMNGRAALGALIVIGQVQNFSYATQTAILLTLGDVIAAKLRMTGEPLAETVAPPRMPETIVAGLSVESARVTAPSTPKPLLQVVPPPAKSAPADTTVDLSLSQEEQDLLNAIGGADSAAQMNAIASAPWPLQQEPIALPRETDPYVPSADPGLLSPAEDPRRYPKPEPTYTVTKIPVVTSRFTIPAVLHHEETTFAQERKRSVLVAAGAIAAVLVLLLAGWWHYTRASTATLVAAAPPAVATPVPTTLTLAPVTPEAAPAPATPVAAKPLPSKENPKPAELSKPEPAAPPAIVLAPPKPRPEAEPVADLPAPTLALQTSASMPALPTLTVAKPVAAPHVPVVMPATLMSRSNPVYPAGASHMGIGGIVKLNITISASGRVSSVRVLSGHPLLAQAAADAVRNWKYSAATEDGKTVESTAQVSVNFSAR
ncbi:MAG: TonB family protein [Terriglobales bacterium]